MVYEVYNKLPLFEYAYKRKEYINNVAHLAPQIVKHLCLIRYSQIIGGALEVNHLKQEVITHITNIVDMEIKGGSSIEKAVHEGFEMADVFNTQSRLYQIGVVGKFIEEKITPSSQEAQEAMEYVASVDMPKLEGIIASETYVDLKSFLD